MTEWIRSNVHSGIPGLSWHALRHLHGTLLSDSGVPVAVAQAQLGHADPRITLSIYTHVLPGAQREAVDRLERYLFPNVPNSDQS
jgi:integrase